ncbi:predicted protein [Sclerotinia sclerotiorum 1980 UF-70]|uniref:Uncharacterized protein n=2 Tax=Sclerotinia sclerotiorum (strain ATCC 18683 / 1980 / Ss-1) TaxID=665079 RepID=A7F127_SCLS1|nr:predicted protein [Sclerotinia sclerotiorum 1980 UF-70]APA13920.1 hypothetical protein sscle_12g086900 [Sclerotinia sclerotiorum 1980 UF-70]EDN95419.1 predicted protein [Sclerotinia sclerotiorum 1980 UF-70]
MNNGNDTQPSKKPEDEETLPQLGHTGEIDETLEGVSESLNVDMESLPQPVSDDPPIVDPEIPHELAHLIIHFATADQSELLDIELILILNTLTLLLLHILQKLP